VQEVIVVQSHQVVAAVDGDDDPRQDALQPSPCRRPSGAGGLT